MIRDVLAWHWIKCTCASFNRATLLPEDKTRAVHVHLRHKLWTTPLRDHDLFALLLDLFAAALVGEAAGGGLWRLSLIGGTRLITFYRASLWPSPSASSSLFKPGSWAESYSSRLNCTRDVADQSERCAFALQDTPARLCWVILRRLVFRFGLSWRYSGIRVLWHRDNATKDHKRAKNTSSKTYEKKKENFFAEGNTHSKGSGSRIVQNLKFAIKK